jgi:hypothetical protein
MKIAAVHSCVEITFLDHICPLVSLLDIPLIVSDEKNALLAAKYYPEVRLRFMPDFERQLLDVGKEFDALITCGKWSKSVREFFHIHLQKDVRTIFCPHGQSDKGALFLAHYAAEEAVLLYGDLMEEMLRDLKIPLSSFAKVGNFRAAYFQKHKQRLSALADREIFSRLNK